MKKLTLILCTAAFVMSGCYSSPDAKLSKEEKEKHKWTWHPGGTAIKEHDDLNCEYCKQLRKKEIIEVVDSILKSRE